MPDTVETASRADREAAIRAMKQDMVYAYHILDRAGQGSGIAGHLTARRPGAQSFWTHQWHQGFDEVEVEDLIESDFELNTISGEGRVNPTLHIHTRIYRARPDIACIVHTHGINTVALGALGKCLEPFWIYGSIFFEDVTLFDEFDGVVLDKAEGDRIADALGSNRGILLRNHGLLVVGDSVRMACIGALTLERSCEVQLKAMAAGDLQHMPAAAARQAKGFLLSKDTTDGRWGHLTRRLLRARPDLERA
jgi:L-fuculose-phosphate aldolase